MEPSAPFAEFVSFFMRFYRWLVRKFCEILGDYSWLVRKLCEILDNYSWLVRQLREILDNYSLWPNVASRGPFWLPVAWPHEAPRGASWALQ